MMNYDEYKTATRIDMIRIHYSSLYKELCAAAQSIGNVNYRYAEMQEPDEFAAQLQQELDSIIDKLTEHINETIPPRN